MTPNDPTRLDAQLQRLHLDDIQSHFEALAAKAAEQQWSHVDFLARLIEGEAALREDRASSAASATPASPCSRPSISST